jgi:hypothetical protein
MPHQQTDIFIPVKTDRSEASHRLLSVFSQFFPLVLVEMEDAEIPGGGSSGSSGHSCDTARASADDTDVSGDGSHIKDLEPLWTSHPLLAAAAMLTRIWVETAINERWTTSLGIVE